MQTEFSPDFVSLYSVEQLYAWRAAFAGRVFVAISPTVRTPVTTDLIESYRASIALIEAELKRRGEGIA